MKIKNENIMTFLRYITRCSKFVKVKFPKVFTLIAFFYKYKNVAQVTHSRTKLIMEKFS